MFLTVLIPIGIIILVTCYWAESLMEQFDNHMFYNRPNAVPPVHEQGKRQEPVRMCNLRARANLRRPDRYRP